MALMQGPTPIYISYKMSDDQYAPISENDITSPEVNSKTCAHLSSISKVLAKHHERGVNSHLKEGIGLTFKMIFEIEVLYYGY